MSTTRISAALRRLVAQRAAGCCEYCRIHENEVMFAHEVDHVVAEQHGGQTVEENLCLACFQCNRLKGPNLAGIDTLTGAVEVLFHPRLDDWCSHFRFIGAEIEARTPRGRATANTLRMNAPDRVRLRSMLIEAGRRFA